jgi:hypothetical protein
LFAQLLALNLEVAPKIEKDDEGFRAEPAGLNWLAVAHKQSFLENMTQRAWLLGICLLCCARLTAHAQVSANHVPLIVGTKEAPPFAMKGADGKWTGISIELWQDLAAQLKLDYRFREMNLEDLLSVSGAIPWTPRPPPSL